jgi:TonB family protein
VQTQEEPAEALAVLACAAPGPTDARDEGAESPAMSESARVDAAREGHAIPTFTPFSVRPTIKNRDQVVAALKREYAALREDPGIGGTAEVWFFINEEPRVQEVRLNRSSGHRARDAAAIEVADVIEFTPALNRTRRGRCGFPCPSHSRRAIARKWEALSVARR